MVTCLPPVVPGATTVPEAQAQTPRAIASLAASMAPGEWRSFSTSNINSTLGQNGASGYAIGYSDDMIWDPSSRKAFFIGGDHNDVPLFVHYTDSTNAWQRLSSPSWFGSGTMHGDDHSAINPATGDVYHRPYNGSQVYKYRISTGIWSSLPNTPSLPACCGALEYYPELSGLVVVDGYGDV
jgi:hypothetical protein